MARKQSAESTQGIGNKNLVIRDIARFLIPIPPQTIATILELNAIISDVIPKNASRKKNIPKVRLITIVITPIIPKFKDTIPSAFPIFFSTIIC